MEYNNYNSCFCPSPPQPALASPFIGDYPFYYQSYLNSLQPSPGFELTTYYPNTGIQPPPPPNAPPSSYYGHPAFVGQWFLDNTAPPQLPYQAGDPNLVYYTYGTLQEQLPPSQAPFFVGQQMLPRTYPYLHNLEPSGLLPLVEPNLSTPYELSGQDDQFQYMNIVIPALQKEVVSTQQQPCIVSIPVPISETSSMETAAPEQTYYPISVPATFSFGEDMTSEDETVTVAQPGPPDPDSDDSDQPNDPNLLGEGKRQPKRARGGRRGQAGPPDSSGSTPRKRGHDRGGASSPPTPMKTISKNGCKLCLSNKETTTVCYSHTLRDKDGKVCCPILRQHICRSCGATGDYAHTSRYCPKRRRNEIEDANTNRDRYCELRNAVGGYTTRKY